MRPSLLSFAFVVFCGFAPAGRAAPGPVDAKSAAAMPVVAIHRIATKEELELLNDALMKVAREAGRWAYTETTLIKDEKGKVKQDKVVRHDPSKPYADQDVPLQRNSRITAAAGKNAAGASRTASASVRSRPRNSPSATWPILVVR